MEATEGVLPDEKEIAVKRLFYNNKHKVANFHNEVDIISSVGHKNLTWKRFQAGKAKEIYGRNLMLNDSDNSGTKDELLRVVQIELLRTQESSPLRPTMSKVLQMIRKKEEHLPAPASPPFTDETTMELNDTSENPSHPLNSRASASLAGVTHSSFYPR